MLTLRHILADFVGMLLSFKIKNKAGMLAFKQQSDQARPTTSSQGKQQEWNPTVPQGYKTMLVPASTLWLDLINWHLFKIVEQATLHNIKVKWPPS